MLNNYFESEHGFITTWQFMLFKRATTEKALLSNRHFVWLEINDNERGLEFRIIWTIRLCYLCTNSVQVLC